MAGPSAIPTPAISPPFDLERLRRLLDSRVATELIEPTRRAAVAALFKESAAGLEILLIRRADRVGDPWSGHMALPGGHSEPHDLDLIGTAVRETHEEVGIQLDREAHLLGRLNDVSPFLKSQLCVRPFVFGLHETPVLALSREVQEALWVPIQPLISGGCESNVELDYGAQHVSLPAWDVEGRIVWGLTYRILRSLFDELNAPTRV